MALSRRSLLAGAAGFAFAVPALEANQKVTRIGYASAASAELDAIWFSAFRQGLRDLGYVEGENLVIERRLVSGAADKIPQAVEELVRLKVDVLVIYGIRPAVKAAAGSVPLVFTVSADPVGTGLVASLARPGGNITGLSDAHSDLAPKRLSLLREIVPSAARVAVLFNPAAPVAGPQLKAIRTAAPSFGATILPIDLKGSTAVDIDRAFAVLVSARPGALIIIAEPTTISHQQRLADLTLANRLPAISTIRQWAEAGLLVSYGTNFSELWRRSATYVDKILKGARAGELPIEQPTTFDLVVNMKTARAIGITIPSSVLLRADQILG